jgi:hypothetical protein
MFKVLCFAYCFDDYTNGVRDAYRIALKGSVMVQDDVLEGVDVEQRLKKPPVQMLRKFSILAAVGDTLFL